jgi:hypothetical protein
VSERDEAAGEVEERFSNSDGPWQETDEHRDVTGYSGGAGFAV